MKKHVTPVIVACLLLLFPPALYVGSYLALVYRDWSQNESGAVAGYRMGGDLAKRIFWPLEQIDRKVRRWS
jgi:hypothetical protein